MMIAFARPRAPSPSPPGSVGRARASSGGVGQGHDVEAVRPASSCTSPFDPMRRVGGNGTHHRVIDDDVALRDEYREPS